MFRALIFLLVAGDLPGLHRLAWATRRVVARPRGKQEPLSEGEVLFFHSEIHLRH